MVMDIKLIYKIFSVKTPVSKNRILYLDFIRGLLMLSVLYHHALAPLNRYILQFHMPALFLVSGYTEGLRQKEVPFCQYVKGKFLRLMVPYMAFELVNVPLFLAARGWLGHGPFSWKDAVVSIVTCVNNAYTGLYGRLWFLPAMFVASVLAYGIKRYLSKRHSVAIIGWCLMLFVLSYLSCRRLPCRLPFTIDTALLGAAFLLLGYVATPWLSRFFACRKIGYDIILLLLCGGVFVAANKLADPTCYMYTNAYSDYPFMVVCALSGTALFFIVVKLLTPLMQRIPLVQEGVVWYSVHSLAVFPVHLTIKVLFIPLLERWHCHHWAVLLLLMLLLSIPLVNLITNYCPWMLGQFPHKGKAR